MNRPRGMGRRSFMFPNACYQRRRAAPSTAYRCQPPPSLAFQSISPGNYLEFAADGFLDRNDGSRFEYESRKHRTKLVNGHRIVALYQHMPTPLTDSYHEEFDLEIGGRLPLTEYFKDSLLGILVLYGRTLRAFEPADHVFHWHPPNRNDCGLDGLTRKVHPRAVFPARRVERFVRPLFLCAPR